MYSQTQVSIKKNFILEKQFLAVTTGGETFTRDSQSPKMKVTRKTFYAPY